MSKASEKLEQAIHAFEQNEYGPTPQQVYEAIKAILEERALLIEAFDKILGRLYDAGVYGQYEIAARISEVKSIARTALSKAES